MPPSVTGQGAAALAKYFATGLIHSGVLGGGALGIANERAEDMSVGVMPCEVVLLEPERAAAGTGQSRRSTGECSPLSLRDAGRFWLRGVWMMWR